MKNCQYKEKKNTNIIIIIFFVLFFNVLFASNCLADIIPGIKPSAVDSTIQVWDKYAEKIANQGVIETIKGWKTSWSIDNALKALEKATAIAYKKALSYFLNELAYNTATYLATGDKGQNPMFETDDIGDYLVNVTDNAAGVFLETLGKKGPVKFNLCKPDFSVQLKISLGLLEYKKPKKPECTFTKMKENWGEALDDPKFLNKFQDMFNPWSNDLGIALSLQTGILATEQKEKEFKGLNYEINRGIKAVRDSISNKIKTPAPLVGAQAEKVIDESSEDYFVYTGDAVADAISVFINTLSGKLLEKWFKEGIVTNPPDNRYDWDKFDDESGSAGGGIEGAKDRFRELIEPQFGIRGDYDILAELTVCSDPNKAGPTNCVITDNFRQAIGNRLTVGQALNQGYLNSSGIFGFNADGLEPSYNEGYPYRSMIILRKFRILPVGWEVAAQYIKDHPTEIDGTKNLGDLIACYDDNDDYNGYWANWCKGLVEPSWVLKAPLNYCKREGFGPEIISEQVVGEGYESELSILRNDNYCADEQSCIKENSDGSCQLYGYCTEERRGWNFNANSCEPRYNTCQTFRNRDGSTASYLENSIDYGICSIDNVGCLAYCEDYDYSDSSFSCTASSGGKKYFDKNAEECGSDREGCHEFIRTKAGGGANLLTNSSFEEDLAGGIWEGDGVQVDDGYKGLKGLQLTNDLGKTIPVGPADYAVGGEFFTLSFYAKDCGIGDEFALGDLTSRGDWNALNSGDGWQFYQASYAYDESELGNQVSFFIDSSSCVIDAVKLERGDIATVYSDYRGQGLVYEKLAPDYLNCDGVNDPAECNRFTRECSAEEVNCELYTSVSDGFSVPAKVVAQDYCPQECVGYDIYIQRETAFDSSRDSYFVPTTAQICGAEAVGCDEFTNLDKITQGGEATEYYSYLRQCVVPSDDCAEFYVWEGSDESGYQLKVFSLLADDNGEPVVTEDDQADCNETIYNLSETDPSYNADCRQFYNRNGEVSYHLYTLTKTCSENCHPYRRTENNIDPNLNLVACSASGSGYDNVTDDQFYWDANIGACYFCKNGGEWKDEYDACIYMAIPGEGISCASTQAGCREYSGNVGNNMQTVFNNDFEDGTTQGWTGVNNTLVNNSNESIMVGGHSLYVSGGVFGAVKIVGNLVTKDSSYVLSFIAKSDGASQINSIKLFNSGGEEADFSVVSLSSDWRLYRINLASLNHEVDSGENLVIGANGNFYIDDIRLTEIVDRYYLIKNSWQTPASCDQDIEGNPYPLYMLGCDQYQDRDSAIHYLHSFSQLCQESAVGCEVMIDTHNYSDYRSETWNDGGDDFCSSDEEDCVYVSADNFTYVVYDESKKCNSSDKGCQMFGEPYEYGDEIIYKNTYLFNNPDNYSSILCTEDAVGCEEWASEDGSSYFKDPGDMVCEWRQAYQGEYGWYKKKVSRCDTDSDGAGDGDICRSDNDCDNNQACRLETNDDPCPTSYWKTFGYGGAGSRIDQPSDGWAGLCPASESSCGEYIDPVSGFSINTIFNSDFSQDVDHDNIPDGWVGSSQDIELADYTLYRLAGESNSGNTITLNCSSYLYELGSDNYLSNAGINISLALTSQTKSRLFYSGSNTNCAVSVSNYSGEVELKKAILDYQLRDDLDYESCNGVVNFEEGCVLFDERKQDGSSLASLIYDADISESDGSIPQSCSGDSCDSNVLLNVTPGRVCDKWLACRSYIKDENGNNVCFDTGSCNSVDDNGNCNNFILTPKINQAYSVTVDSSAISNMSGYAKVGYAGGSLNSDYYPLGAMEQEGEVANIANGGFEIAGSNSYPIGWTWEDGTWDASVFKVINNPIEAQTEGIGYAPEGNNFLKLGSSYSATSEFIDVVGGPGGTEYILTAYINTINLKSGAAKIKLEGFDSSGNSAGAINLSPDISLTGGNEWIFKLGKFTVLGPNTTRIRITLYSDSDTQGNYYFDDIKIRSALNSRIGWYTPQSCRLYPQSDSLSCDYYDDSWKRQKGWSGYCLEYDRYPGAENACLLWWPVDKVKGEGVEEGAGYIGKIPVYYCLEAESFCDGSEAKMMCTKLSQTVTSTGQNKYWSARTYEGSDYQVPFAEDGDNKYINWGARKGGLEDVVLDYTRDSGVFGSAYPPYPVNNPYEWDGEANTDTNVNIQPLYAIYPELAEGKVRAGTPYYIKNDIECFGGSASKGQCGCPSCSEWMELGQWDICRVTSSYGGRCYTQRDDDYNWEWQICDICENEDCDNCTVSCYNQTGGNMASSFNEAREGAKRIFTQSYGTWQWNGGGTDGRYESVDGQDWGSPTTICAGASRPDYPNDYCAVLPRIVNIKANNGTGDVEITKNQFINLTFNSDVDGQQLPIVMYAIDWGDDEETIVTGVEMRARPNEDNPHSLYHLYSYWDLKAKDAQDKLNGGCGSNCEADGYCDSYDGAYCRIRPSAMIKDNWGWCNSGSAMNDCDQWEAFTGWIVVKER